MLIKFNPPQPFIFVANTKTASTSIEELLGKYCHINMNRGVTPGFKHMSYRNISRSFNFIFKNPQFSIDRFYKFGVFRDPVDWAISWFNYRSREKLVNSQESYKQNHYVGDISFDEFVSQIDSLPALECQRRKFIDKNNNNAMDFIIRYEHLNQDFAHVLKVLGLPEELELPHENQSTNVRIVKEDLSSTILTKLKNYYAQDYEFLEQIQNMY